MIFDKYLCACVEKKQKSNSSTLADSKGAATQVRASLRSRTVKKNICERNFYATILNKIYRDPQRGPIHCASLRNRCTWTFDKRHMPGPSWSTTIKHQTVTITIRCPQCGHSVSGERQCATNISQAPKPPPVIRLGGAMPS